MTEPRERPRPTSSATSAQVPGDVVAEQPEATAAGAPEPEPEQEIGGPKGPEPTRFGDWERKGRCIDF